MKLNDEQRKLVEDNYYLMYYFSGKHKVPLREYSDILAYALCKAAYYYDAKKGEFSTIAMLVMKNELLTEYTKNNAMGKIPSEKLSHYEYPYQFENSIGSSDSPEKILLNKMNLNDTFNGLMGLMKKDRDKQIIIDRLNGMSLMEIGAKHNMTHQNVSTKLKNLKKRAIEENIINWR